MTLNARNQELVAVYASQGRRLQAQLALCPKEMWEFKTVPEHWSIREVLHHLADAELNFVLRIRFALGEPGAPIHSFDQEAWGRNLQYAAREPETALALYEALGADTQALLSRLSDAEFEKTVQHPQRGPLTVAYLVGFCDVHLKKHLEQIQRRLKEWKERNPSV